MLEIRLFLAALLCVLTIGVPGSLRAENPSPGVPPIPSDSRNIIQVTWSESEHAATIEIAHQKFASPDQITEVVRGRLKADPATRFLVLYKRAVPLVFVRYTALALRDAGVTAVDFLCDDATITTPPPNDIRRAGPPANQTTITVRWSAVESVGSIEIDHQKYARAEQVVEPLQTKVKANPATRILIRAYRNVPYPFLKEIMLAAGKVGAGKVTFSVVEDNPPAPTE